MPYVTIPKDLTKVKSKVLFNLTKRQLVCFSAGLLVGVPLFFLTKEPLGKNALLAEYNLQQQIGFCDEIIDGYSGFVFQNRFGSLLSSNDINRALERIYTACNNEERERAKEEKRPPVLIRHFSVHNLRHTFCTRFCENESNLKVIQEIMGHADIETTMNIYAEATTEKKVESFANLEGKIKIS